MDVGCTHNTRLMLGHLLKRWPNIFPTLIRSVMPIDVGCSLTGALMLGHLSKRWPNIDLTLTGSGLRSAIPMDVRCFLDGGTPLNQHRLGCHCDLLITTTVVLKLFYEQGKVSIIAN